jgi:drug/metabolite transporter (DMT)-like permease
MLSEFVRYKYLYYFTCEAQQTPRATLINLTLTIVALLFFSFFHEKPRKNHVKAALIYSLSNKPVLP